VEILSPSNTQEEIDEKRDAYLRAGAKEVWLCDRDNQMTFFAGSGQLNRSRLCPDFPVLLDLSQRPINKLQEQLLAAYNQLVKTPEDRARLEKENPDLVAERDRIVTAQKRALLGVTRLFVRYCTLRSHLLNEEPEREDCGIAFSGQLWGCVVSVGDHDFCR
jgi:hypothetical protein